MSEISNEPTDFPNNNSDAQPQSDFSTSQLVELNSKIDDVLYQLKLMGLGQEIIFQEIEELKKDACRVTKKDLGLMVIGKVVEFGSTEVGQIPEVQELYRYIANTDKGLPPFNL